MTIYTTTVNDSYTTPSVLSSLDTLIVNQGVTITGTGDQVYSAAASTNYVNVGIYGSVFHFGLNAIDLAGLGSSVIVGAMGVVQSLAPSTYSSIAVHVASGTVLNYGLIRSSSKGVVVDAASSRVTNEGTIDASANAIIGNGAATIVTNSGTVQSYGAAISLNGLTSTILNSGLITSGGGAVSLAGGGVLRNSGTITTTFSDILAVPAVSFTAGGIVENTGLMNSRSTVIAAVGELILANDGQIISGKPSTTVISAGSGEITNTGDIVGGLRFTSATLAGFVTNSGTIHGDIQFSNAGGVFSDAGGTVTGAIKGGAANDRFNVNSLGLTITDSSGIDFDLVSTSVDFTLGNGLEGLKLTQNAVFGSGNSQDNIIEGNGFANILLGDFGADSMLGNGGADSLFGGQDNDTLFGGDEDDLLNGGARNDVVSGDDGSDVLRGMAGNDYMDAGADDDLLLGGTGNDSLYGGDGSDVLTGGAGKDVLVGGADDDTFVFGKGDTGITAATRDAVTGFTAGVDTIDLSRMDANTRNANPNDAFTFIAAGAFTSVAGQLHYVVSGANILLEGDNNADGLADFQIQLNGIAAITMGDLVL